MCFKERERRSKGERERERHEKIENVVEISFIDDVVRFSMQNVEMLKRVFLKYSSLCSYVTTRARSTTIFNYFNFFQHFVNTRGQFDPENVS